MARPLLLDVALTHLAGRRRQTAVSMFGVALGVGFFIAMAALMQGFQTYFVQTVIDVSPHVTMRDDYRRPRPQPAELAFPDGAVALSGVKPRREIRGIQNGRHIVDVVARLPGVAVAPTLDGPLILRYGSADTSATVTGIEPERERRVTRIEQDMTAGTLESLSATANGIILGGGIADKLGAQMGDTIIAVSPAGVVMLVKVVGLFRTGIVSLDDGTAYMLLIKTQILQDRPNVINRIRLRLDDVEAAREVAARLEERFGYRTESWQEANRSLFGVFVIQNTIMYSVVGAILVVAGFGIFNVISTVVYEKSRDIAILKSLGFAEGDIRQIFLIQGVLVGLMGTVVGWGLGYLLVQLLASLRFEIGGMVRSDRLILHYSIVPYLLGALFSVLSSGFAAWLPARRAARLNPVDIIRGAA